MSSEISQFYKGSNIFVTGGTGFVGKVLIEKILRSFEDTGTIYLLMRTKRGICVETRLQDLLNNPIFNRIKKSYPERLKKIKAVNGDMTSQDLGLNNNDKELLMNEVNIVFHSAANVRFDQDIKQAVVHNALGTQRLLELCTKMKFLKSFVHVSTAFSNADKICIEEKVYKAPYEPNGFLKFAELIPEEIMFRFPKKILKNHPNTYTFAKAMAEHIVHEYSSRIPSSAIVRPSIITPAWREPYPGWVDNLSGITGIFMECSRGTIRSIICDENCCMHLIPVDIVVNTLITSAWFTSAHKLNKVTVFNCTNDELNPITWKEFKEFTIESSVKEPSKYVTWYPNFSYTTNKVLHLTYAVLLHLIPSLLLDIFLYFIKRKPIMFKISQKFHSALLAGSFFSTNQWDFKTSNMNILKKTIMYTKDNDKFDMDLSKEKFDWKKYVGTFNSGIRKYILKDEDKNLNFARKKLQRLHWFQNISKLIVAAFFVKTILQFFHVYLRHLF